MEVVVYGSILVDFISYVPRLPKPGETIHGKKFSTGFGGKGANQCVAAARLGSLTGLIAKLGNDTWGNSYLDQLKKENVNIEYITQCENETTGIAQISVADNGENNIVIVVGANNLLSRDDITKAKDLFENAKILICQLETPIDATLSALRAFRGTSILNAAPAVSNISKELIEAASIFCVNETEAALIIGKNSINNLEESKSALLELQKLGGKTVIITLGALGAVYVEHHEPQKYIHVQASKVEKVVDTTGAGDAFIGSLAFFLSRYTDCPFHQLIGAACEIASISVQLPGTQSSFPYASQVENINPKERKFAWSEI